MSQTKKDLAWLRLSPLSCSRLYKIKRYQYCLQTMNLLCPYYTQASRASTIPMLSLEVAIAITANADLACCQWLCQCLEFFSTAGMSSSSSDRALSRRNSRCRSFNCSSLLGNRATNLHGAAVSASMITNRFSIRYLFIFPRFLLLHTHRYVAKSTVDRQFCFRLM